MRALEELALFVALVKPLTKANHSCTSLNQLARWTRIQDDKARRTVTRLAEAVGDPLLEVRGRRYCLTTAGQELLTCGEKLLAVGRNGGGQVPGESLAVEVAPGIDPGVLAGPLHDFFEEWAGLVTVKIVPLDAEGLKQNLATGVTAFGLDLVAEDGAGGAVLLEQPARWTLLVPAAHSLVRVGEPITDKHLAQGERVFIPAVLADCAEGCLSRLNLASTVVVPSPDAVRAFVGAELGLGLELDFATTDLPDPLVRLRLAGAEPVYLGLVLPKKAEALTEAAKSLADLIRQSRKLRSRPATGESPVDPEGDPEAVAEVA
jgi:DNA-binding transcriptional LysR family regulator